VNPKLRSKLIEEWRGLPQVDERPDRMTPVAPVLEKLLAKLGFSERLDEDAMLKSWKALVGEFLAAHSAPVGLKNGELLIRVTQPTVRYELDRVWKKRILTTMQNEFGKNKIRSIRFQL
jgi:predicted nucleic acid-binding Zn ribbon protein